MIKVTSLCLEIKLSQILTIAGSSLKIHELLGITIDWRLTFENHINKLCKEASQKLKALAGISNYMTFDKRKIIMKAFITSQVSY